MLCAIQITKTSQNLITLLNSGVVPEVAPNRKTYFVFDDTWNSDIPNEIVTERVLHVMMKKVMRGIPIYRFK